jgi:N-acylneuraminate cytidylyltransferase
MTEAPSIPPTRPPTGPLTAIVPMKGHSQRVPRKNLRPIAGRPLFHWIVDTLRRSAAVTDVVVETDSDEIAASATAAFPGLRILRRPSSLMGDEVSMNSLLAWHISQLDGDRFLQTHATNPLLSAHTIDAAAAAFAAPGDHDSLFGVTRLQTRLYWADGRPVNHDPAALVQTQDLPPLFEENSTLYLFTRQSFAKNGRRIGDSPLMFQTPPLESVDIDWEEDFAYCRFLLDHRQTTTGGRQ